MSTPPPFSGELRRVLLHPTGGVAGLVDELLVLCEKHALQLDWQADRCRVRCMAGDSQELTDVPLRKSVFRAILARVAALCNERSPSPISPYGGQAEIAVGADSATVFRVAITNTPSEQRLELMRVGPDALGSDGRELRANDGARPVAQGGDGQKPASS
jgi:hypothetical protein